MDSAKSTPQRIIGRYTGKKDGPLLIVFGAMHGNEPAGVLALERMFDMLEKEPTTNPDFDFKGRLVGITGNLKARKKNVRFLKKDLNRQWTLENVAKVKATTLDKLDPEEQEMKELLETIDAEINDFKPSKVVFLDLHTTTAFGGIFSIPNNDPESLRIAMELHAPVVKGLLKGIKGTTLHYFINENFKEEVVSVTFESGQHNEDLSVNRAIAALTNCMRTIGCVQKEHVENRHDSILIEYSKTLPKITELVMIHEIKSGDDFQMKDGYKNFQSVKKGELLAHDRHGEIRAEVDGAILMPLYQKQGDDGFFLVKEVSSDVCLASVGEI